MKKVIFALIALIFVVVSPVFGANDIDMQGGIIRIGTIDGTAWSWLDTMPEAVNGMYIHGIFFHPGVTGDKVVIQWQDANGIEIISWTGADIYDDRWFEADPSKQYKLYIDFPDLNDDALLIIHTR
jgi:hypothetical protein